MLLPLDGVHVKHVHAVLHRAAVPGARVGCEAPRPAHHAGHAPLAKLGEKLGIEVHSTGSLYDKVRSLSR